MLAIQKRNSNYGWFCLLEVPALVKIKMEDAMSLYEWANPSGSVSVGVSSSNPSQAEKISLYFYVLHLDTELMQDGLDKKLPYFVLWVAKNWKKSSYYPKNSKKDWKIAKKDRKIPCMKIQGRARPTAPTPMLPHFVPTTFCTFCTPRIEVSHVTKCAIQKYLYIERVLSPNHKITALQVWA